nr:immunoglobulin heavy chain junction region [Macaca mulatta]MOV47439.1 immunoglobulin heavy chain junction region [Macaca mulatta]MOV47840.1 immunoglobulin heavy chain junction region [Macaca mulatta]MOV48049.1 immunoglobulin heavy chain junction region [Macaca mulatta]MOV48391.1 immunoglobulin heavy chain junction region [Macaca mulatta]
CARNGMPGVIIGAFDLW